MEVLARADYLWGQNCRRRVKGIYSVAELETRGRISALKNVRKRMIRFDVRGGKRESLPRATWGPVV